ncbi:MAG: hypothetical protein KDC28_03550 [Saprospiraceae bacterium]|nr:hypothetical protein [Saprospiraceae bacterium]MCB9319343.1 hypothetical protein [Lewinellaceae bacterium]
MYKALRFLFVIGTLVLTGCTKENPAPVSSLDKESKAKAFFETSVSHPVLFTVLNVPENKSDATGWIISNEGDIRSFTMPINQLDFQSNVVALDYLVRIMGSATVNKEISFADILPHYQANKNSAYGTVTPSPDEIKSSTTYYFGYTGYDKQIESQTTCGSGHPSLSTGPTPNYYYQVTLEMSGLHNAINENPGARSTVSWLKSLAITGSDDLGN